MTDLFCCKCGTEVGHINGIIHFDTGLQTAPTSVHYTWVDGSIVCRGCWDKNDLFCKIQDDDK